jgi:hypothetical protein
MKARAEMCELSELCELRIWVCDFMTNGTISLPAR